MSLKLFAFFHLNIFYSSIDEKDRSEVIKKCYWPLLKLIKKYNLPLGIEMPAITAQIINEIDPLWIKELKGLLNEGLCELIGSGYAQIIGPLVPPNVSMANLKIGNKIYKKFFRVKPSVALVNEQTFSSGLVSLYKKASYQSIIMEYDNPAAFNPLLKKNMSYYPQKTKGPGGEKINLIWNRSIMFQKFQRYAHGQLDLNEMVKYIKSHYSSINDRAISIYGNDVEIFDYRPGRYKTESPINKQGEWERINILFEALLKENNINFVKPSSVLKLMNRPEAGKTIELTTAEQPIAVKKQSKYNVTRWAVTGRNDMLVNTICWKLYVAILKSKKSNENDWQELCYLWSSDFRTHITAKRWNNYLKRLKKFSKKWKVEYIAIFKKSILSKKKIKKNINLKEIDFQKEIKKKSCLQVIKNNSLLNFSGKRLEVCFNLNRGLAIEYFKDFKIGKKKLFGTIEHGYFQDIRFGSDFYSGHTVFEPIGKHKITDLLKVRPQVEETKNGLIISAVIKNTFVYLKKTWTIDDSKGVLSLNIVLNWNKLNTSSLRLAYITLIPRSFNKKNLQYRTHNGGFEMETQFINNKKNFSHCAPASSLISSTQGVGTTNGIIEIGDEKNRIKISFDKSKAALIGLLSHSFIRGKNLTRLMLSAREFDDTSKKNCLKNLEVDVEFCCK